MLPTSKKIKFTLLTLGIAMFPIVILELGLLVFGWSEPNEVEDPFLGLTGDQTLFEQDGEGDWFQIKDSRLGFFRPAKFLSKKPENGFRVFVLGGSTVQGRPWETETAFGKWLEICLQACQPDRSVEVINCGGVSYASYRLSHVLDEVLGYSPDLIVLCTGHNEYLEARTYHQESRLPSGVIAAHQLLANFRSYRWFRSVVLRMRNQNATRDVLGESVITRLDYENGLNRFSESNLNREATRQHFQYHIEKMINAAADSNTHLLVVSPPFNEKDCFPFKPAESWSPGDRSEFNIENVAEIEPDSGGPFSADFSFFKGNYELAKGNRIAARKLFQSAVDNDICPLRITTPLRESLAVAVEKKRTRNRNNSKVLYLDLQILCQEKSPQGIVGDELLVDHVHPSIGTHKLIAVGITELLQKESFVPLKPNWMEKFEAKAAEHQASLGFGYYQRGKDRLKSVLKWSRGNAQNAIPENQNRD